MRLKILQSAARRRITHFRDTQTYRGKVLEIGVHSDNKKKKQNWVTLDIVKKNNPDVIGDVAKLPFKNNSFDTVLAYELFEHVQEPEKGLSECSRVLKKGGEIFITVPFLKEYHADPYDFQRWTHKKWHFELKKLGFTKINISPRGGLWRTLVDLVYNWSKREKNIFRYLIYLWLVLFLLPFWWVDKRTETFAQLGFNITAKKPGKTKK